VPAQLGFAGDLFFAGAERDVGGGSSHIEADAELEARPPRPESCRHGAAGGTGEEAASRFAPDLLRGQGAAFVAHEVHAHRPCAFVQALEVARDDGADEGVE
jgi:hypothetical protein